MKLSIIIPVFNEEKTIIQILKIVTKVNYGIPTEIIVINDGSTDDTTKQLEKAKKLFKNLKVISYKNNKGKGFAVRTGMNKSTGDILIIQDADMEYDPNQIPKLIKPIINGEYKVVYGSRFSGKVENMDLSHLIGNKFLTFTTSLLFDSKLTDMETCYKVMHRSVLKKIQLKSDRFEIEPEITAKILKSGYKIKEIPIDYSARTKEQGKKIRWSDGIKSLIMLFRVKFDI